MTLVRWEPIEDLAAFRSQLDHLVESFLGKGPFDTKKGQWVPVVDEAETDNEIVVRAELPGVDEKDISVTLTGNTLTIKGQKKEEKEEKGKQFHRMESYVGSFERSLTLPVSVDPEKIKAECKKGVLEVHLPKRPEMKPKEIPVSVK